MSTYDVNVLVDGFSADVFSAAEAAMGRADVFSAAEAATGSANALLSLEAR